MKQAEKVLRYMQDFGSITQLQAMQDLGVMRLASRVSDLRKAGYLIRRKLVKVSNRYGEVSFVARYSLEETNG